ncbi:MAG: hypothetical protein GY778_15125 [bacterium]|nr:hypothetical protein [bacterium]
MVCYRQCNRRLRGLVLLACCLSGCRAAPGPEPVTTGDDGRAEAGADPMVAVDTLLPAPEDYARQRIGSAEYPIPTYAKYLAGVRICVNPGHGGDAHKRGFKRGPTGVREAEVNLRVARYLVDFLTAAGADVRITRDGDVEVSYADRAAIANEWGADLFISCHHNAIDNKPQTNYTTVWYHRDADYRPANLDLARYLCDGLQDVLGLPWVTGVPLKSDQLMYERGFAVLRHARVTSALVETSFFTNPEEEQRLRDPAYNLREAYGLFRALAKYAAAGLPRARLVDPADGTVQAGQPSVELEFELDDGLRGRKAWGHERQMILTDSIAVRVNGAAVPFRFTNEGYRLVVALPEPLAAGQHTVEVQFQNLYKNSVLNPHFAIDAVGPIELTEEARRLHQSAILIDGHNDLPWQIRALADSSFEAMDIAEHQSELQTDIPRLRRGGVGAQFWVVYVPPETARMGTATEMALQQFDLIHRMIQRYPDDLGLATTADDVERIHAEGKIASLIGIEGGHTIQNSLDTLVEFHRLGARYLGLTHSETIDWADSATDEPRHAGLTGFGERVVLELNRLGMLVDLAHVSADTMRDALRVSRAPVIFSHSSADAIAPHSRNVPDDVLRLVAENDGVVMVNFYSGYIHPRGARVMARLFEVERRLRRDHADDDAFEAAKQAWQTAHPIPAGTVGTLVDHIDHIVEVAGIDHVGLGGDYDGTELMPMQLEDVSGYPYITQELLNRGYGEEDIHKILGGNLLRALRRAEEVARDWKEQGVDGQRYSTEVNAVNGWHGAAVGGPVSADRTGPGVPGPMPPRIAVLGATKRWSSLASERSIDEGARLYRRGRSRRR